MARFEIEIDDTSGDVTGEIPPQLKGIFDRIDVSAHGKGYQKAVAEAKPQIESGIKAGVEAEMARLNAALPIERDKWGRTEEENKRLNAQLLDLGRERDQTLRKREEDHARDLLVRAESIQKRNQRIQALVKQTLRGESARAGARDESLEELEEFLFSRIGFDDDMEPYVRQTDGSAKLVQGKPQSIPSFVKEYIDAHPHHRKPPTGVGGGARGGATRSQVGSPQFGSLREAQAALDADPGNNQLITAVLEATRAERRPRP